MTAAIVIIEQHPHEPQARRGAQRPTAIPAPAMTAELEKPMAQRDDTIARDGRGQAAKTTTLLLSDLTNTYLHTW